MAERQKKTTKKKTEKKVTRYTCGDIKEPRTPETGHTPLLPGDEQVVTLPMNNGWSKAIVVGKLPDGDDRPVIVDMDPAADPVLFWAGKRNRREVPVLPLQRNEIVTESRIAQIIERARKAAQAEAGAARQGHLFADLEKQLRESERGKRVEFYIHDEDYDGDCFVDCQMFFDFKKKPAASKLGIPVPEDAFRLQLVSEPFAPGRYRRIAVEVVDVYGNESTVVKELDR